jgi:hypothetical protein
MMMRISEPTVLSGCAITSGGAGVPALRNTIISCWPVLGHEMTIGNKNGSQGGAATRGNAMLLPA